MTTTRNKSLLTIAILLGVMALLSITSTVTARLGVGRVRPQGTFTNGGNFQGGNGTGQGAGTGTGQGNGNFQGGTGNGTGTGGQGTGNFQRNAGGFNAFSIFRTLGLNSQVMGYVTLGLGIVGILLLLLGVYGVWMQKKWGLNLAMVMAVIFLIGALPGLFSLNVRFANFNSILRLAETIVNAGASIVILFMGILPSVRDSVS